MFLGGCENGDTAGEDGEGGADTMSVTLTVGERRFSAKLYGSRAAGEIYDLLPLTLNMSELNANEKYCYLDRGFTVSPSAVGQIKAGDIMLCGNNCLVLFYKSSATSYSYTRVGEVSDAEGLAEAPGDGDVTVVISK